MPEQAPWLKQERVPGDEKVTRTLVQWVPGYTASDSGNAGGKVGNITEGN